MDFIYRLLADYCYVFLVIGIILAVALLGFLSKISKNKKNTQPVSDGSTSQPTAESQITSSLEQPQEIKTETTLVIGSPQNDEPQLVIEPSLDGLETQAKDPMETMNTAEPQVYDLTPSMMKSPQYYQPVEQQTFNQVQVAQPQMQYIQPEVTPQVPMEQINYVQPMQQMVQPQVMQPVQYTQQPQMMMQQQYIQPGMQIVQSQPVMQSQPAMRPVQAGIQTAQPMMQVVQPQPQMNAVQNIPQQQIQPQVVQQNLQPVQQSNQSQGIEFLEIDEHPAQQVQQNQVVSNSVPIRQFDPQKAVELANQLASNQPANVSTVIEAEPTFGLVIEDK